MEQETSALPSTKKRPNRYWTKDTILEETKKYKTLHEFIQKANGAYCAASKLGILDDLRKILPFHFQANGYWTRERCLEESKKYKTRIEFHDGSKGAYSASVKNGWINDFGLVSTRDKNYGKTYTFEELNKLSKKCYNKVDFKKKYYHAYRFAKRTSIIDDLEYIGATFKEVKYGDKITRIINPKYSKKGIAKIKCKYDYDKLYCIAQKYTTLKEFTNNEPSPYNIASKRGWLKDYVWLEKERHYYSAEECYEIAKTCKTITEFIKKNIGAYTFALKHDLMKQYEWFEKIKSTLEQDIENFLLLNDIVYEKQKKFSWLRYKKPQSLDFYLPEYKIAIECQGIQHFKTVMYFNRHGRTPVKILDENKKTLCKQHGIDILYFSNLGIDYPYKVYEDKEELFKIIAHCCKRN